MAPAVTLGPPLKVGLASVAHDHDRLDPRRYGHERTGDGGADAAGRLRIEHRGIDELGESRADAAHDIAALDGDLPR